MKAQYYFILIQVLFSFEILSQDIRTDISTPKGANVIAWTRNPDFTDYWRNYYDSAFSISYPNATVLETFGGFSSTKMFNCHGNAWHVSEGGDYRWIGYDLNNRDEAVYWEDTKRSYVQISSQYYPGGKVSYGDYGNSDHSATVADPSQYGTGWFVSKWGDKVLMRHAYNDCPYTSSNLKYYKLNPLITGSTTALCNNVQRTFSTDITHMPAATFSWTKSSNLTYVSGASTNEYIVKGTSSTGNSYVSCQVTTPSGFTSNISKYFWVGIFQNLVVTGQAAVCPGNMYNYEAEVPGGHSSSYLYSWTKPSNWSIMSQYNNVISLYVPQYNPEYGTVRVSINNGCGTSAYSGITVYPGYNCGYYYVYYPNPTTDEINVEAIDATTEKTLESDIIGFSVRLFDSGQNLVTEGQTDKNKITVDVHQIPKGTYFLHIIERDQIIKKQVVIE